jgi:hypothetical protein
MVGAGASVTVSMIALSTIGGPSGGTLPLAPQPAMVTGPVQSSVAPAVQTTAPSTGTPAASASASHGSSAPPVAVQRQFTTDGGAISARCTGQQAYLISWSPAPGFHPDDVQRGPGFVAHVTFVGRDRAVSVRVRCVAGVPQMSASGDD